MNKNQVVNVVSYATGIPNCSSNMSIGMVCLSGIEIMTC